MATHSTATTRSSTPPLGSTSSHLLRSARLGDSEALGRLLARYLPRLSRWAHGRLPAWVRATVDTSDLVHDAVLGTIRRLPAFEARSRHALAAYLRAAVRNRIRDEHRRFRRRGTRVEGLDRLADRRPSPFELASASEDAARYRRALARLRPRDRELIVAHVELGYTHEQLGCMTARSPNAARMALQRAIHRLAELMRDV
jgi:RNA polymerase sigma factor (sigma-70 family)